MNNYTYALISNIKYTRDKQDTKEIKMNFSTST